jgi:hypothetical protein
MPVNQITKNRFDALCYSREPIVELYTKEHEWYANQNEQHLGIVIFEEPDQQWFWIILGRDERAKFRCVDLNHSLDTIEDARADLCQNLLDWEGKSTEESYQGDVTAKKNEIFRTQAKISKLHTNYKILESSTSYSPARGLIEELAYVFTDLDGNYIKDFQSTGFNARLWELYLFAFLYEQKFSICEDFDRPDFLVKKGGFPLTIEATTVNPTEGIVPPKANTLERRKELLKDYMPIKFGSALYSKLKKKYWELPHMTEVPLAIAIHDFHLNDSMTWSSTALHEYLYGLRVTSRQDDKGNIINETSKIEEHTWKGKTIPSGFFNQPDSEHISAVIFSNAATLTKFNRIGKLANFGSDDVQMIRVGDLWNPDPKATRPTPFKVMVDPKNYCESWSEGIRIFHNPNALHPIPVELFPHCSHHWEEDGKLIDYLPKHFIFNSFTQILVPEGSK